MVRLWGIIRHLLMVWPQVNTRAVKTPHFEKDTFQSSVVLPSPPPLCTTRSPFSKYWDEFILNCSLQHESYHWGEIELNSHWTVAVLFTWHSTQNSSAAGLIGLCMCVHSMCTIQTLIVQGSRPWLNQTLAESLTGVTSWHCTALSPIHKVPWKQCVNIHFDNVYFLVHTEQHHFGCLVNNLLCQIFSHTNMAFFLPVSIGLYGLC